MKSENFSKVDEIITSCRLRTRKKCLKAFELRSKYLELRWETLISKEKKNFYFKKVSLIIFKK